MESSMKEWKSHFWHGNMKDLKGEKPKNFHEKGGYCHFLGIHVSFFFSLIVKFFTFSIFLITPNL